MPVLKTDKAKVFFFCWWKKCIFLGNRKL